MTARAVVKRPSRVVLADGTTLRLAPGTHASPQEGVCVVELASVIAREDFTDEPECVCPVIGAILRGLNDRLSVAERAKLVPYATRIVGSRAGRAVTRERRDICLEWVGVEMWRGAPRRAVARAWMRLRIAVLCGLRTALEPNEGVGEYVARYAIARADTEWALELVDALLAVGSGANNGNGHVPAGRNGHGPIPEPLALNGNGRAPLSGNGHASRTATAVPR